MEIKLLIGLGNPGKEFSNTYHSVGHLFINFLAGKNPRFTKEKQFEYSKNRDLILAKTSTFMNQSGRAVVAAKKIFHLKTNEILIVHDDIDIPLGSFRLVFDRGSAGHKGIDSVFKSLRTKKIYRLRIGIHPKKVSQVAPFKARANNLVLRRISRADLNLLQEIFAEIETKILGFKKSLRE